MATLRRPMSESIPHIPPPWTCKAEAYWLPVTPTNLPVGIYDVLESSQPYHTAESAARDFKGGLGMIQILRYTDTPVGPYDELLIIPGKFKSPEGKGKARLRITRVYVSQRDTTWNGRHNWNIPKHLARFEFSAPATRKGETPPRHLRVAVYPPNGQAQAGAADTPFFQAMLTPAQWLPAVPFSMHYVPLDTMLVQAPLPAANEEGLLCGTKTWKAVKIGASTKRARFMWTALETKKSEVNQDGKWWPDIKPWSFGMWLEEATLEIPIPVEFDI